MFEVFSVPERTPEGRYRMTFFVHGIRHRPEVAQALALGLRAGELRNLESDPENPEDSDALKVVVHGQQIGFVPRYLLRDLHTLRAADLGATLLSVRRVNPPPTPLQFRVLASFDSPWPQGSRPFAGPEFSPLPSDLAVVA